jgi:hypothetical protein
MANITQIPAPRVPIIDEKTGLMAREWYRFLLNLFTLTGDGSNTASLLDLQVGPPLLTDAGSAASFFDPRIDLAQLQSDVDGLKLAPRAVEIHPIPYGSFFDTTTQTGSTTAPTTVTFNSTDVSSGVYLGATTSRMYVTEAGVYSIQFSVQLENTDATEADVNIWLRINGVDVLGSNGLVWVAAKHAGFNGHAISGWNFFLTLAATDYVELVWVPQATTTTIKEYAAQVGPPAIPATYSAVLTAFKVNITSG